ncbi:MAG: hypothetical protein JXR34_11055, partial [Bacteroidales bacterium]|nr:hypothetical protein [Bacteroidales bacterium]
VGFALFCATGLEQPAVGSTASNLPESDKSKEVPGQAKIGGGYHNLIQENRLWDQFFRKKMVKETFVTFIKSK